jgi:hypothetical protein
MFAKLRPSPATVLASLALVVALGGTAFAGPVARLAKLISGSTIKPRSIPGNRLKNDTLTGKQIKESSLGTVPNATSATNATHASTADSATNATRAGTADSATNAALAANANAVGGITVRKVFYAPATATPATTTILSLGGLTLNATCTPDISGTSGTIAILVTSAVDHSHFSSEMFNSGGGGQADGLHHTDFNTSSSDDLTDQSDWGETSFTYTKPDGTIVNGQLSFDSSNVTGGDIFNHTAACLVSGVAMSTAAS